MSLVPQWKRVLLSGSNFEVNQLTSSEDLGNVGSSGTYPVVFSDPVTRGWKQTSSIYLDAGTSLKQLHISDSFTLNSPDNPISASQIGSIASVDTHISTSLLFLHNTTGRFEYSSSFNIEPVLSFEGSQSANANHLIRSGSDLFGPNPAQTAKFDLEGNAFSYHAVTFTGSYEATDFNYIFWDKRDFIEWRRSMPENAGITSSFSIPYVYQGAIQDQDAQVQLRRWQPNEYNDPGFYIDSDPINFDIADLEPGGAVPGGIYSGSLTGSFEVTSVQSFPIQQNERWQLVIKGHQNFAVGFSTTHGNVGSSSAAQDPFTFELKGATNLQSLGAQLLLGSNTTGSFVGDIFGNYSGSLSGVTLNDIPEAQSFQRGNGIILVENDGSGATNFIGGTETTMSVKLVGMSSAGVISGGVNKSGLTFEGLSEADLTSGIQDAGSKLQLGATLPQQGLEYDTVGFTGEDSIQIKLEAGRGLELEFESLSDTVQSLVVSGGLLTDGLTTGSTTTGFGKGSAGGSASIDLDDKSGLTITEGISVDTGKLMLSSSVAGYGLLFPETVNDRSELNIDTSAIVTSSGKITIQVNTSPAQTLAVGSTGTPTNSTATATYGFDADDGTVANVIKMNFLDRKIDKSIELSGSVLVKGDLKILSSSNVSSIHAETFQTTDQFIRLNSGSQTGGPFTFDNGGFIIQTSVTNSQASGSALFFDDATGGNSSIGGQTFSDIGWGVTQPNKIPWNAHSISGSFDKGAKVASLIDNDYAVLISTVKLGADNSTLASTPSRPDIPSIGFQPFYSHAALASLGAFYIDTGSTGLNESNVYIYGIFDD